MCGILGVFGLVGDKILLRKKILSLSKRIRHRGPDWNGIVVSGDNYIAHERLAIVNPASGAQPITSRDEKIILSVNGEIYNHKALKESLKNPDIFKTGSDCEVILHLYKERGENFVHELDGKFSFILFDGEHYMAARDPIGVTSLYKGENSQNGSVWFASELKCLQDDCDIIQTFPPGHYYSSKTKQFARYYSPRWLMEPDYIPPPQPETDTKSYSELLEKIRTTLEKAVVKRLMSDVPYGILLSGGLDSSLVAAIANRHRKGRVEEDELTEAWWPQLHTFAIGLPESPDLQAASKVAKFLGTVHHSFNFTIEEGIDALTDVIYHLETYDVTTIRASTPMYLLSRKIKSFGVKMVLSGEGSDEIFGGYLYFHSAPTSAEFHQECVKRVRNLHLADCLRANKSTMAWGVEARVPFLDKAFLEVTMNIDPELKRCSHDKIEKYILRKAFDTKENPYLPDEVLWRQKEQFSDGVGYNWINSLKEHCSAQITDQEFQQASTLYPFNTPQTKEAFYFRKIFQQLFPSKAALETVEAWVPRTDWGCSADPSGRSQHIHQNKY